jgi:hypothetical protein
MTGQSLEWTIVRTWLVQMITICLWNLGATSSKSILNSDARSPASSSMAMANWNWERSGVIPYVSKTVSAISLPRKIENLVN